MHSINWKSKYIIILESCHIIFRTIVDSVAITVNIAGLISSSVRVCYF